MRSKNWILYNLRNHTVLDEQAAHDEVPVALLTKKSRRKSPRTTKQASVSRISKPRLKNFLPGFVFSLAVIIYGVWVATALIWHAPDMENTDILYEVGQGNLALQPSPSESNALSASTGTPENPTPAENPGSPEDPDDPNNPTSPEISAAPATAGGNCTSSWGPLMLINPNYTVSPDWIASRKTTLIDLTDHYGIMEAHPYNGRPLLDAEAAAHLSEMLSSYSAAYPGHSISTMSCFRSVGTSCGRLCYATGTSDHHSGYTCDLIDTAYGSELNTDLYSAHPDWQWLHLNSYKYGFVDRFVPNWAGGSMSEPVNVDATGTTGLYETWHFRYVGLTAATEIATGKYNNGEYDSLEHYLKASGRITNLLTPTGCKE